MSARLVIVRESWRCPATPGRGRCLGLFVIDKAVIAMLTTVLEVLLMFRSRFSFQLFQRIAIDAMAPSLVYALYNRNPRVGALLCLLLVTKIALCTTSKIYTPRLFASDDACTPHVNLTLVMLLMHVIMSSLGTGHSDQFPFPGYSA